MEQQMIFSVSEANNFIKALLDRVPQLQEIFVRGEISNYKLYPSGHHYFTLKDAEGAMRCVLFKGNALRLRFRPENGMKVIAFDIYQIPVISEQLDIPYVEMDELLAKSDFISVHAPAVDGGALINAERIAKMKDGVVIINTSRGSNVDEDALLAALESGKVRAAGLDVYADEPASNVALYSHPMVSCTPHIGAATVEAQKRIGQEVVEIIAAM